MMKIAFLVASTCFIGVVLSYDAKANKFKVTGAINEAGRRRVPCATLKGIILEMEVADEATLSQFPETDYRACLMGIQNMLLTNRTVIDKVSEGKFTVLAWSLRDAPDGRRFDD